MATAPVLTVEDVYDFIAENGGKVTNRDLVKHFKKYLGGPDRQADARAKFTEIVNTVATVKPEDNVKYLILKKDFKQPKRSDSNDAVPSDGLTNSGRSGAHSRKLHSSSHSEGSHNDEPNLPLQIVPTTPSKPTLTSGPWSPDLPPGHTPQPPPRRKSSRGKENRGVKHEESAKQLTEDMDMVETRGDVQHHEEIIEVLSPGSVREKAQKLNKMASEIDLTQKGINGNMYSNRRRDHKHEKGNDDDDDTCSVTTLDPRRKEWMVSASRADYHALAKMLKEEPRLANCKDFNSTALHWAAKHGNLDVIKLMAGTHKVNSNAKTSGYTPLHLAAMFDREEIMEVLINTYGADPNVRDFSGKRPVQYLPKNQAERFVTLFPNISANGSLSERHCAKAERSGGFHRIGSLNSKVKKTSVMLAGGRAITRMKSWGSADNIQDRYLMPPPKLFPKKKKSRKEYLGISEISGKLRSGDSDSDSNYSGPSS